ncbi:uncharacterized protein METZ01_LOCUS352523 [marine metagenome]|uniref:Uncharacterized protein n=1 Tax=marine metagenome TaxID=408172 RepID=A0A382RPP9_9ZZZZ
MKKLAKKLYKGLSEFLRSYSTIY